MKNLFGILLILCGIGITINMIIMFVQADYHYENDFKANWDLADKSSTIAQKSEYIDKFVEALDNSGLHGTNDALIWKTNNNSFDTNFKALKSLQSRLDEIKGMDESSLAYQTAIQQITAQEQGQADEMLSVFEGCWTKVHYYWLWNPFLVLLQIISIFLLFVLGVIELVWENED